MAVKDFTQLDELEQIEAILKKGFPMGEGKNLHHQFFLYRLDDFFVIVSYSIDTDQLIEIITFSNYSRRNLNLFQ
ncbi:MAG TPA: hypothetical protein VM935_15160 [Chitinophagaceae bacterium]|nr:hypothetical protein [Chitinophagaceae bacterium]